MLTFFGLKGASGAWTTGVGRVGPRFFIIRPAGTELTRRLTRRVLVATGRTRGHLDQGEYLLGRGEGLEVMSHLGFVAGEPVLQETETAVALSAVSLVVARHQGGGASVASILPIRRGCDCIFGGAGGALVGSAVEETAGVAEG